jgi:putative FmdB family regulatory protein
MPIYEYRCEDCERVSSFLVRSIQTPFHPRCKRCQGERMSRLISRIARVRSEESRLESLADPSKLSGLDENDPASMARWMKRMGKELGEDMGEDFDAMVEEAMAEEGTPPKGGPSSAQDDDL